MENVDRFTISYNGVDYPAVEIDGACVSDDITTLDYIVLADCRLAKVLWRGDEDGDELAVEIDNSIFGYCDADILLNGTKLELEEYAKSLL